MTFPHDPTPLKRSNRLNAGECLRLAERDYLFGVGPLTLEVIDFDSMIDHPNIEWVRIRGRQISPWNNSRGDVRVVDVRAATIAAHKIPPPPLAAPRPDAAASEGGGSGDVAGNSPSVVTSPTNSRSSRLPSRQVAPS